MVRLEADVKKAVNWITEEIREHPDSDRATLIDQASQRFGLSPLQAEFLYRQFLGAAA